LTAGQEATFYKVSIRLILAVQRMVPDRAPERVPSIGAQVSSSRRVAAALMRIVEQELYRQPG
jgi:hypothetical protein